MKVVLSFLIIPLFTVFAQAEMSVEDQKVMDNPVVTGFLASVDKSCSLVKEDDSPVRWMCTGAVLENEKKAFEDLKETKMDKSGFCGISIMVLCSDKNIYLNGEISTTQIYGADNKPYGDAYEVISFDEVVVEKK